MNEERFIIRAYGKSELAMIYFPKLSPETAMKLLKTWLRVNPRLQHLVGSKAKFYTPKQVKMMVEEFGEPFDLE